MTTARNARCPCGSGRKYKNCHGRPGRAGAPDAEAVWRRLRRCLDDFPTKMMRFVDETYGRESIDEAWAEFTLWEDDGPRFDPDTPHLQLFMPWFFHRWRPDPVETGVRDPRLHDRSPGSVLLERRGLRLDPLLRRYVEACVATPHSFHEILNVDPGRGFQARDVLTGDEHRVLERSASRTMRAGEIIFGQLVAVDGATLLEACAPCGLPHTAKLELIDLRERMERGSAPITPETVDEWELELRELYLDAIERVLNPSLPHLQNTDGDDIVFHRLLFEIDSPGRAFDGLKHLALDNTEAELLGEAEFDVEGELERLSFEWTVAGNPMHTGWNNTIHGHLEIDGRELRAEVNSVERAARLRAIIDECLGDAARHLHTEIRTLDELRSEREGMDEFAHREEGTTPTPPELLEFLRDARRKHLEDWVTQEIPALGGLTPEEAVKTPSGREKVEVLIHEIAKVARAPDAPIEAESIRHLRKRLGLT